MLTSMVKRVDVAVFNLANKTTPGISNLGLKHYQARPLRVAANADDAESLGTAQTSLPSDQVLTEAGA